MNNLQCSPASPCCANKHFPPFYFLFFLLLTSLSFFPSVLIAQQQRQISGTVSDDAGERLRGVTVGVKNRAASTQTDSVGRFRIEAPDGATLVFTYIGKQTRELQLGNANNYPVVLANDSKSLEEVIVSTGYMTQRKVDVTGAISVVNRNDFVKTPSANVMRSLQGKVPGLLIGTDGNPAENVGIQIRGISSIGNSAPTLIVLDGQPVNINLRDINPNDIESMQVLKDAASASIYGSRAAGGVILINTRKGRKGVTSVTYDGYVGVSQITGIPKMMSSEDYGRGLWQATVNDGDDPTAIQIYSYDWGFDQNGVPVLNGITPREWLNEAQTMPSSNTNWFEAGTRNGLQQNHQLTISGGGERMTSLFSLNYYNNQGTQLTSFFRRLAARFNNDYELIKGRVTIGENLTLTNLRLRDVNSTYGFLVMPPNIPVYANDGSWGGVAMPLGMDDYNNPVRQLKIGEDNIPNFVKVLGTAYINAKILNNLTFRSQFGIDYSMWYERRIDRAWEEAGGKSFDINGVTQVNYHNIGQTWTNTLTYNLKFGENRFDILGGIETYKFLNENMEGYRSGLLLETRDYAYLSGATGENRRFSGGSDNNQNRNLVSYFGKINYSFAGKYLLSGTIRRDGASVFGENKRFGTFPAVSAGWRINSEKFMKRYDWIDELKLRASWGQNGNSAPLGMGKLVTIYLPDVNGTSYPIAGNPSGSIPSGYIRSSVGNADLQWETTTQIDFGVDFSLFNNKVSGSFDWFNKKTANILFLPPYIAAMGEGAYRWVNAADMTNKGIEVLLSYGNSSRDFSYRLTLNASTYRNKVISLPDNVRYAYGGNGLLDDILGRPLNSYYGLVADGIFKTQEEVDNSPQQSGKGVGRIRYRDLDGDGSINEIYDKTWLGSRDPDLMAGLNVELTYKNFDLTFFIQGFFGNEMYNNWKEMSDFWNISVQNDRNHPYRLTGAWTPNNPNADIPALSRRDANGEKRLSSYYIENGSYIKMRTLDIGYNFPDRIASKMGMTRLRLYISGQNLFLLKKNWGKDKFTGLDPEFREPTVNDGFRYPMPRVGYFGVNVSF